MIKAMKASPGGNSALGHIPSPLNLDHAKGMRMLAAKQSSSLPQSYDLRTLGRITVKDQGLGNTCWAFVDCLAGILPVAGSNVGFQ